MTVLAEAWSVLAPSARPAESWSVLNPPAWATNIAIPLGVDATDPYVQAEAVAEAIVFNYNGVDSKTGKPL